MPDTAACEACGKAGCAGSCLGDLADVATHDPRPACGDCTVEGNGPCRAGCRPTTTAAPSVVFKYAMTQPVMRFTMPTGARVIDVRTQYGVVTLWALCPAEAEPEQREFIGRGTGHPILEDGLIYVGSAHDVEGQGLVFHIFERPIP